MPSFERRIRGDGTTVYRARVRLDGARPVAATFGRLTDAKRLAEKTATKIRHGRYFRDELARQHTLAEDIDRYVAEVLPRKPRTAPFQARQLAWRRARLGHLRLIDLSASDRPACLRQAHPGSLLGWCGPRGAPRLMLALGAREQGSPLKAPRSLDTPRLLKHGVVFEADPTSVPVGGGNSRLRCYC